MASPSPREWPVTTAAALPVLIGDIVRAMSRTERFNASKVGAPEPKGKCAAASIGPLARSSTRGSNRDALHSAHSVNVQNAYSGPSY